MSPRARRLLIAIAAFAVTACSSSQPPTPATSPANAATSIPATTSPASEPTESATAAMIFGGYLWTRVDPQQFSGVGLDAVSVTRDGRLVGLGNSLTAEGSDGSPRQPTTWTSPDGRSWTRQPDSAAFVSKRAFWEEGVRNLIRTESGFIAVGTESQEDASQADAAAWLSPDGVMWTRATVKDRIGRTMDQVVAATGGLVALGEAAYDFHAGFGAGTAIWTSRDGRAWTRVADTVGPPHGTRLQSVVSRPGGFLATSTFELDEAQAGTPRPPPTAGIWTSNDAIHWQPISGTPLGLNDLIRTDGGYLAVGSGVADHSAHAIAWCSTDGRTWTSAILPPPADLPTGARPYVERVVSGPTGFLAFGERDDTFAEIGWSSPDGVTWTAVDLDPALHGAVIDYLFPIGSSFLLSGHLDDPSGAREPVMWLLRP
jgi:hypothetical protein